MLSTATRLTRREDFATAVQRGRRAACGSVVVHLARASAVDSAGTAVPSPALAGPHVGPKKVGPKKVGFVVGRTVGGSVVRHRVQRRLRHLMRERLAALPAGALVVVRALPASAGASSAALGEDLDGALRRLIGSRTASAPSAASHGSRR
ncbi:MAG: ribonuclease P protein component [Pseudonocardiales bacterium]|nr:ribonuclease P protein component [Pseudonocardiales bacterium]MBV9729547.1 ribonuclease P protein component [Pseudonocardiales bacterium]